METLELLIVDDEPGMVSGMERVLRDAKFVLPDIQTEVGFTIQTAGSGEDALEIIQATPPDIMLLDHKLPGLSGLDVLDQMHPQKDTTLTVMITAYASLETAVTAIKRGAHDFLAKPFTPGELKSTVRKAVDTLIHARQAKKLAEEKRQVRFQFISVLAHELKAPIGAIEGYLDIVRKKAAGDDPAVYDHMLERCHIRLDGMRKMIFDLLDLTRIESGQKVRELHKVDVVDVARNAIESNIPMAGERNIEMNLNVEGDVSMVADRSEIEIIFNNLVSNAVKYNRENGRVDISIANSHGQVTIVVKDTGIGMSKEEADRLFNDFVRIKNSKTKNILGSGLGLSIVKKLAYLYHGEIKVDSDPDVGSTFTVVLREAEPETDAQAN